MSAAASVTRLLAQIDDGYSHAAEQLLPLVYDELAEACKGVLRLHAAYKTFRCSMDVQALVILARNSLEVAESLLCF